MTFTPREMEVIAAIQNGAHSMAYVARALRPPISSRGVERLIYSIADKIPPDLSPYPWLRVVIWADRNRPAVPP